MAFVEVNDWQVKPGAAESIIALLGPPTQWQPPPGTPRAWLNVRTYSPSWTRFIQMTEWSSFAEMEQWYAAFWADPVGQDYWRKVSELIVFDRGAQHWEVLKTFAGSPEP